jgi:hypothetical protein
MDTYRCVGVGVVFDVLFYFGDILAFAGCVARGRADVSCSTASGMCELTKSSVSIYYTYSRHDRDGRDDKLTLSVARGISLPRA